MRLLAKRAVAGRASDEAHALVEPISGVERKPYVALLRLTKASGQPFRSVVRMRRELAKIGSNKNACEAPSRAVWRGRGGVGGMILATGVGVGFGARGGAPKHRSGVRGIL